MSKQRKLSFGKDADLTTWGLWGMARGMYSGGYTRWVYGVKGLFKLTILECWGDFSDMKL